MPEETFEEKARNIKCPINLAIDYIARNGIETKNNIYYLERKGEIKYDPDTWATQHQCTGNWVGIKEVIRVAYLYATGVTPNPHMSDEEINKIGPSSPRRNAEDKYRWTTDDAKEILEGCKFVCKCKDPRPSSEGG